VLIFPSPFRAPVCPHLPLSVCSLLASLHAPCPSKSADRRSTPRLAGQPLHSTASFPAPIRAPSHCPRPSHRAPVPCCRGLTAHPSDAFACSFSSFRRVRSVSCTILRFLVCAPPRVFTPLSVCCVSNPRLPLSSFAPPRASPHLASIRFLPLRVFRQALRSLCVGVRGTLCKTLSSPLSSDLWDLPCYFARVPSDRTSGTRTSASMSEACGVGNGALDEVPLLWWDASPRLLAV